jgi:hypothetical protein
MRDRLVSFAAFLSVALIGVVGSTPRRSGLQFNLPTGTHPGVSVTLAPCQAKGRLT